MAQVVVRVLPPETKPWDVQCLRCGGLIVPAGGLGPHIAGGACTFKKNILAVDLIRLGSGFVTVIVRKFSVPLTHA